MQAAGSIAEQSVAKAKLSGQEPSLDVKVLIGAVQQALSDFATPPNEEQLAARQEQAAASV